MLEWKGLNECPVNEAYGDMGLDPHFRIVKGENMGDKSRLCIVCGTYIPDNEDIVLVKQGGSSHLECAWNTRNEEEVE